MKALISRDCEGDFARSAYWRAVLNIIFCTTLLHNTTSANCLSSRMEKININYPEEKVLRLFTTERKPLTSTLLLDYLKSLDFGTHNTKEMSDRVLT
jgi:hypothetical protein